MAQFQVHPRERGANRTSCAAGIATSGTPPRARGEHFPQHIQEPLHAAHYGPEVSAGDGQLALAASVAHTMSDEKSVAHTMSDEKTGAPRGPRSTAEPAQDRGPAVAEWTPETDQPLPDAGAKWDGRSTRLRMAFPILRDHVIVPAGETIIVRASQHPSTKRWWGPEAAHVEDLFALGMIHGSTQAEERIAKTHAVEMERGAWGTRENPAGRPELRAQTSEQVQRTWERALLGGPDAVLRAERSQAKTESAAAQDMAAAAAQLAQVVERLVGNAKPAPPVEA